ncbi:hypothetical protein QLQ12_29990 [Actinoplanes sp. NEAU-A12]|uniref:Uncharacterized protein n=1 Tax=Actinoplanes sandaracinus TaxID=3045177 RepID=A0ABT6WSY2_9ACTN|nr:hypothetical protein [Actinoplanes sandaracinus]MDI6102857.1 hypothetical protein [Actinoplanes sandaracinus]
MERGQGEGCLLKDLPPRDLARAVRLAGAGVDQHDSTVLRRLGTALDRSAVGATPRIDLTQAAIYARDHGLL